jgi:hypothetical protein
MRFSTLICFAALGLIALIAGSSNAQTTIRAPFTQVDTGPGGVRVLAPFVNIQVPFLPAPPPMIAAPPVAGPPPMIVAPPAVGLPPLPAGVPAPTVADFAATFKPVPGTYDVVLQHPFTQQPVKVSFTLPRTNGYYRVRVRPRFIEFDAPDHVVEIRFLRNGRVEVEKY